VAVAALLATPSSAVDIRYPTFRELVSSAAIIARVELTDTRTIDFEHDGEKVACGYIYNARIIETLKGPSLRDIAFFWEGAPAGGLEGEFLLMAIAALVENRDEK
jgi:hypothetical protein